MPADPLGGGIPLTGDWFDRTQEFAARRRGESYDRLRHATEETLVFDPLPCWRDLLPDQYRRRVLSLVEQIEEEATLRRSRTGARPPGREALLAPDPHHRPAKIKKSPAPFVYAVTKAVRRQFWEAYASIVAAYRTAADRLRAGDREAVFPLGCFPPALPFVGGLIWSGQGDVCLASPKTSTERVPGEWDKLSKVSRKARPGSIESRKSVSAAWARRYLYEPSANQVESNSENPILS